MFLVQIGAMLGTALVFGQLMGRLRQPVVLGELLGGVCLGPTVLGALAPAIYARLFPPDGAAALARAALIDIGMLFFLFVAGLEVNLAQLRRRGLSAALTSLLGTLVPFGLGWGSVWLFPGLWGAPSGVEGPFFGLFVGTALSISALPVIARILMDLKLIHRDIGVVMMTAATINDIIGWTLFAVVLGAAGTAGHASGGWATVGSVAGAAVLIWGVGHWLVQPIVRRLQPALTWPSGFIGAVTVLMLGAAALLERLGLHAILGAFLAGVALGQGLELRKGNQAHEIIYQFAVSFFAPLYFVSIGLRVDFAAHFDLGLVLFVLVIASAGKLAGAGLGAWLGGMAPREAMAVGWGMNARGAMEMILASVALDHGIIDQRLFVALVVMAFVTSMLSGPFLQRLGRSRAA
jgi:Kef-type K+ transport system membrane component KefB